MAARRIVEFHGEEAPLRAWLVTPGSGRASPAVVMAHGFTATIDGMVADRYASYFVDAGFAVLLFDHESLGRSGGTPRQRVDPWLQARGYRRAIDHLAELPFVDGERIALWGDSMSAGVALAVTAVDERVRAVVAQVPALGAAMPQGEALFERVRDGVLGTLPTEETTRTLPVVSPDQLGSPSHLVPLTAFHWFIEYGARHGTHWENWATRVTRRWAWSPTACGPYLRVPSLYLIAPDDEMPGADPEVALETYRRTPGAELAEVAGGHFGLLYHREPEFARVAALQAAFLQQHLG